MCCTFNVQGCHVKKLWLIGLDVLDVSPVYLDWVSVACLKSNLVDIIGLDNFQLELFDDRANKLYICFSTRRGRKSGINARCTDYFSYLPIVLDLLGSFCPACLWQYAQYLALDAHSH